MSSPPEILSRFASYVMPATPAPPLPCVHTCEGINFRSISEQRQLRSGNDRVVYLFYGRPAYRPSQTELPTQDLAYAPVTLVLKKDRPLVPDKMFPFDSGAFVGKLYQRHFHPQMRLDDFLMMGPLEAAGRIVSSFFGSNENYYFGMSSVESPPATEFEAKSYFNLIHDPGPTKFDDRRGSVEIQIKGDVVLDQFSVELVVLPHQFLSDTSMLDTIVNHWHADIRSYVIHHDRPDAFVALIRTEVHRFYAERAYL